MVGAKAMLLESRCLYTNFKIHEIHPMCTFPPDPFRVDVIFINIDWHGYAKGAMSLFWRNNIIIVL